MCIRDSPADYHTINSQHPHWPLIVMLVLTQLSVGALLVGLVLEKNVERISIRSDSASSADSSRERQTASNERNEFRSTAFRQLHATTALAFGLLALGASTLHLGRPRYAFRAVIGLRHSWLSREIVAFGAFAGSACLFAGVCWLRPCLLYTSPSPRDQRGSRMPSSA